MDSRALWGNQRLLNEGRGKCLFPLIFNTSLPQSSNWANLFRLYLKPKYSRRTAASSWMTKGHLHPFFEQSDTKRIKRACKHILNETKAHREMVSDGVYFPPQAVLIAQSGTRTNLFHCLKTMCIGRSGCICGAMKRAKQKSTRQRLEMMQEA